MFLHSFPIVLGGIARYFSWCMLPVLVTLTYVGLWT